MATEEEMRKALFGTLNKKASGVSGLEPVQLKAMKQNDSFVKYLTQAYNELTAHPEGVRRIPPIAIGGRSRTSSTASC